MEEENLTPKFKKKMQEWQRLKKGSPSRTTSPDNQIFRKKLIDWQIFKSTTKVENKNTESDACEIPHLSKDFLKKMDEWRKIKSEKSDEERRSSLLMKRRDSEDLMNHLEQNHSPRKWRRHVISDKDEIQSLDKMILLAEKEQKELAKQNEEMLRLMK